MNQPSLQPYPEPSEQQRKLVHRVELFANGLKTMFQLLSAPFRFALSLFARFRKIFSAKIPSNSEKSCGNSPEFSEVHVGNKFQAFDHYFFYCLHDGRLWLRPIAAPPGSHWALLGETGLSANGLKFQALSADGENIVALDEKGMVNYAHTNKLRIVITGESWKFKSHDVRWTDQWVAIPLVKQIISHKTGNHLKLPEKTRAFAISQKGPETGYYTCMNGNNHPEFLVGVSTLYNLTSDGRIFFADPWLANGFDNEITAPEDGQFVAENLSAAASTLFLIRRDAEGRATMYTRFADFDSIGSNPILPVTYNPETHISLVRRLPAEDWVKQPEIQLSSEARLTGNIAVIQIGRGQSNRQLRVEGTNLLGECGYYYKNIFANQWNFQATPDQILNFNPPIVSEPPAPPVNFSGELMGKKMNKVPVITAKLAGFLRYGLNERGLHTTLQLTLDNGHTMVLPLHARRQLIHLFGYRNLHPNWFLTVPNEYLQTTDSATKMVVKNLFKNSRKIAVKVDELTDGTLKIHKKHSFKLLLTESPQPANNHRFFKNPSTSAITTNEQQRALNP